MTLFLDPVDEFLEGIGMIRDGYAEFGRQIAITVVNVLVFAIETVVGIFIRATPRVEELSQENQYSEDLKLETNNRRYQNPEFVDYYNPYYTYYNEMHLNPYKYMIPYDYRTGNYFIPTASDSQTNPFYY